MVAPQLTKTAPTFRSISLFSLCSFHSLSLSLLSPFLPQLFDSCKDIDKIFIIIFNNFRFVCIVLLKYTNIELLFPSTLS